MTNLSLPSAAAISVFDCYFQFTENKSHQRAGERIANQHYPTNYDGWEDPDIPEHIIQGAYWAFRKLQIDLQLTDEDFNEWL